MCYIHSSVSPPLCFQYNFVGRILGPRGLTAKQLEAETGCKIMVRGKSSMRDKKKVRSSQQCFRHHIIFSCLLLLTVSFKKYLTQAEGTRKLTSLFLHRDFSGVLKYFTIIKTWQIRWKSWACCHIKHLTSPVETHDRHTFSGCLLAAFWHLIRLFAKCRTCAMESTDSCRNAGC